MPQITNETVICNMALAAAGAENLIGDFSTQEDSEEWRMCNLFLWEALYEMMSAGNWRFATERVELPADTESPAFGPYEFKAKLPLDLLGIQFEVDRDDDRVHPKYKREGQFILTNNNPCYILYTKKITNVALFPPVFVKVGYTNLAILMRNRLKGADEWFLRLNNELRGILSDALGQELMQDWVIEGNEDVLNAGGGGCNGRWVGGRWLEC